MYWVCVDVQAIHRNEQRKESAPVFIVYYARTTRGFERASRVELGNDAVLVYDPVNPLPNGAVAWIEAQDVAIA